MCAKTVNTTKKDQILSAALKLFNTSGFQVVTIQKVGEELGMSKGNVAYHFANTGVMLQAIHQQMYQEMQGVIMPIRELNLSHLQLAFQQFRKFQGKYRFFFEDLAFICRKFPPLAEAHQRIVKQRQEEAEALMTYFIGKGLMKPETWPGQLASVVDTLWQVLTFWPAREVVWQRQLPDQHLFHQIWSLLRPWLTEAGQQAYQRQIYPHIS
ncbi:MAG: TetR/AcrR family transcriptional regulator [Bacteroidota bacterium]